MSYNVLPIIHIGLYRPTLQLNIILHGYIKTYLIIPIMTSICQVLVICYYKKLTSILEAISF